MQHQDAPGIALHALHVLRRQEDRDPALLRQAQQDGEDRRLTAGVEVRSRLVKDQHLGPHGKGRGDGHPLLLAARQKRRIAVAIPVKADRIERPVHALGYLLRREPKILGPESDLVLHPHLRQLRFGVLKDQAGNLRKIGHGVVARVQPAHQHVAAKDASRGMGCKAVEGEREGRLAGADAAQQCDELSGLNLEVYIVENFCRGRVRHGRWVRVIEVAHPDGGGQGHHGKQLSVLRNQVSRRNLVP